MEESHEAPREEAPVERQEQGPASGKRAGLTRFNYIGIGSLLAVTALIAGLQYFGFVDFKSMSAPGLAVSATDPEKVLATVNGSQIRQAEVDERLSQITNVLKAQGADLSQTGVLEEYKTRILDELIDNTLLLQAAAQAGIAVSDETVDAEFQELVAMFGGEEALDGQLEIVGMTRDELRKNLREQKIIEAYVETKSPIGSIEVTDAEAQSRYDESIAGADPENVPAFEEVKELLKQQIAEEKASGAIQAIVDDLKRDAEITRA